MPPKPKNTKQDVINAALKLLRQEGAKALTARRLALELNSSSSSVFTHFSSMEEVSRSALEEGRKIYARYAEDGLAMTPPFKGFGVQLIRFAQEEPHLFYALFFKRNSGHSPRDILLAEGHWTQILKAIQSTLNISEVMAKKLYDHLWIYVCGIATLAATGACSFSELEISRMLGDACRGFCCSLTLPPDQRTETVPRIGNSINGSINTYLSNTENHRKDCEKC